MKTLEKVHVWRNGKLGQEWGLGSNSVSGGWKPNSNKWEFKNKLNVEGKVENYKSWLVENGYSLVSGIDFSDNFSPIAMLVSIIFLLFVVSTFDIAVQ